MRPQSKNPLYQPSRHFRIEPAYPICPDREIRRTQRVRLHEVQHGPIDPRPFGLHHVEHEGRRALPLLMQRQDRQSRCQWRPDLYPLLFSGGIKRSLEKIPWVEIANPTVPLNGFEEKVRLSGRKVGREPRHARARSEPVLHDTIPPSVPRTATSRVGPATWPAYDRVGCVYASSGKSGALSAPLAPLARLRYSKYLSIIIQVLRIISEVISSETNLRSP